MKKTIAMALVLLMTLLVPLELVEARGGRRTGGRGRTTLRRQHKNRTSRKDLRKMRERKRLENADSLLRDAAGNRRGSG
jgi:hypothetical protein